MKTHKKPPTIEGLQARFADNAETIRLLRREIKVNAAIAKQQEQAARIKAELSDPVAARIRQLEASNTNCRAILTERQVIELPPDSPRPQGFRPSDEVFWYLRRLRKAHAENTLRLEHHRQEYRLWWWNELGQTNP